MKEVEILVMILTEDFNKVREQLSKVSSYIDSKSVKDTYFYDPLRKNLQPDENLAIYECFRVREKENTNYLTYKVDNFDENGKWLYSDEHETIIDNAKIVFDIITKLGLKELVVVDMIKEKYENDEYIITIEYVKNLGVFLEVENKLQLENEEEIVKKKGEIQSFIDSLGFETSEDVGIGKPELLLKKKHL